MPIHYLLLAIIFNGLSFFTFSQEDWTVVQEEDFLRIEVKDVICSINNREQKLYVFRYTNTSDESRHYTWQIESWRNNQCVNCHKIDSGEYDRELTLEPGESVEGGCDSKDDKALYLFGNFVELVPGMHEQYLTDYSFENLNSTILD